MPTKPRERGTVYEHAIRTIVLLRAGRVTIGDLAADLGVGRRTAYRIIAALGRAKVTVESEREWRDVYYRIPTGPLRALLKL